MNSKTQNYWKFYGLKDDPFPTAPIFYLPPRWEQQFDLLYHFCETKNNLLVITGIKGCGKTTFASQFVAQLADEVKLCQLKGSTDLSPEQIQQALSQTFSLSPLDGENIEEKAENLLLQIQKQRHLCLLLIDDAHLLSRETLRSLTFLIEQQSDAQMRMHIILFGLPKLQQNLQHLSEQEVDVGIMSHFQLSLLTKDEIGDYLNFCLRTVGLPAASPFTNAEIASINKSAGGLFVRVAVLARNTLINGIKKNWFAPIKDFIAQHKITFLGNAVVLAGLLIGAAFVVKNDHLVMKASEVPQVVNKKIPEISKPVVSSHAPLLNPTNQALAMVKTVQQAPKPKAVVLPNNNLAVVKVASVAQQPVTLPHVVTNPKIVQQAKAVSPKTIVVPKVIVQKKITVPVSAIKPPAKVNVSPIKVAATVPTDIRKPMQLSPVSIAQPQTANASAVAEIAAVKISKPKNEIKKSNQEKSSATKVAVTDSSAKHISLLSANPNHCTLQLIGLSSEEAIKKFIAENHLGSQAIYFHSKLNGKDWYVLLYGEYPDSNSANAALQNLPAAVKAEHPWVRKMANVQLSLKRQM